MSLRCIIIYKRYHEKLKAYYLLIRTSFFCGFYARAYNNARSDRSIIISIIMIIIIYSYSEKNTGSKILPYFRS